MGNRDQYIQVVSVNDPAIDTKRITLEQMREYFTTRDLSKIQPFFKPDCKPTIYTIREIPHALWDLIEEVEGSPAEQRKRAFMFGVVEVQDLHQRDGAFIPGRVELPKYELQGERVIQEKALTRFWPGHRIEVGVVALTHSFLPPTIGGGYPLPHMCLLTLSARGFLRVDASPNLQASSSDEASPEAPADPTPGNGATSASGSGSPTAVTATGTPMEFA